MFSFMLVYRKKLVRNIDSFGVAAATHPRVKPLYYRLQNHPSLDC